MRFILSVVLLSIGIVCAGTFTNLPLTINFGYPTARYDHTTVYVADLQLQLLGTQLRETQDVLIVYGGRTAMNGTGFSTPAQVLGSVEVYNAQTADPDRQWVDWTSGPQYSILPSNPNPGIRYGHTASLIGKTMYIYGGVRPLANGSNIYLDDMWGLDLVSQTWFQVTYANNPVTAAPPTTTAPTTAAPTTTVAPTTVAPTTDVNSTTAAPTTAVATTAAATTAEPTTATGTTAAPAEVVPRARWNHCAVVMGNLIYIYGGNVNAYFNPTDDFWVFNTVTRRWAQVMPDIANGVPGTRSGHSCVSPNPETILVFGGQDRNRAFNNQVWRYELGGPNRDDNTWLLLDNAVATKPRARADHTATMVHGNRVMLVLGGGVPAATNEVWMYDYYCNRWILDNNNQNQMTARYAHSTSYRDDNNVYIFGGYGGLQTLANGYNFQINRNLVTDCFTGTPAIDSDGNVLEGDATTLTTSFGALLVALALIMF